jgi:hypothetical protein
VPPIKKFNERWKDVHTHRAGIFGGPGSTKEIVVAFNSWFQIVKSLKNAYLIMWEFHRKCDAKHIF